jgi:hypothetical protein
MRCDHSIRRVLPILGCLAAFASTAVAFEGRIHAVMIQGNETNALLYTVGTNLVRVEMTATNWPNAVNILDRNTGTLTLLFPNNRSFVHCKPTTEAPTVGAPGFAMPMPATPVVPPGVSPQPPTIPAMPTMPPRPALPNMPSPPSGIAAPASAAPGSGLPAMPTRPAMPNVPGASGMPAMPPMPAMPMMPGEKLELKATGQTTNLLGFACEQYDMTQRGETLEVWATGQLFPYQPYLPNQPHRLGPQRLEEQWPALLTSRKLFPLRASLRYGTGTERFRFEVQSVTPGKLTDEDAKLFEPPAGYLEIQPLPF